ncbi:hypothetical protein, partial [Enterococcus faecalis]|uniref:hypothetical protein n=1 Tax=Enterococcus faecalis TaxID=1351 RepID=UPI003D6AB174
SKYTYQQTEIYKEADSKYSYDGLKFLRKNFPEKFHDPERIEVVYDILWVNHRQHPEEIIFGENDVTFKMQQPYFNFMCTSNTG